MKEDLLQKQQLPNNCFNFGAIASLHFDERFGFLVFHLVHYVRHLADIHTKSAGRTLYGLFALCVSYDCQDTVVTEGMTTGQQHLN